MHERHSRRVSILLSALSIFASSAIAASDLQRSPSGETTASSEAIEIARGSGTFEFAPARNPQKLIRVYYHRPASFGPSSNILIVIPGAGRDADEYRDHWVAASEEHGVLVLTPEYPASDYDFAAYHFGGVIENFELIEPRIDQATSTYYLKDENIRFDFNADRSRWLFRDFDRLAEFAADAVGANTDQYDIFGHSAGGQILHRMVVFQPDSKARRILASNSGFYTMPRMDVALPFGLKGTNLDAAHLRQSLKKELVVFLGERDDEKETRGTHLRTPNADSWGIGRYARGRRFFQEGRSAASQLRADFRWKLHVVPDVGHDAAAMSKAAATYLYGE